MRKIGLLLLLLLFLSISFLRVANATMKIEFTFTDSGEQIGTGFMSFDDIDYNSHAEFVKLTNYDWEFDFSESSWGYVFNQQNSTQRMIEMEKIAINDFGNGSYGVDIEDFRDNCKRIKFGNPTLGVGIKFDENDYTAMFSYPDHNYTFNYNATYSPENAPVPEPATMLLLGTGLVGLVGFRRRKK